MGDGATDSDRYILPDLGSSRVNRVVYYHYLMKLYSDGDTLYQ